MGVVAEAYVEAEPAPSDGSTPLAVARAEVARELHDAVAQSLTAMLLDLEHFRVGQHGRQSVLAWIDGYQHRTREVLGDVRQMLYVLRGEHDSRDLDARLAALVKRLRRASGIDIRFRLSEDWPEHVPGSVGHHLYRIVQEGLVNAIRHSQASRVTVSLLRTGVGGLAVLVTDNGRGFDSSGDVEGLGLRGIRERCVLIGATLEVKSTPSGGTRLRICLGALR